MRAMDRVLGVGRVASERTCAPGGTVARGTAGRGANCGGRETGAGGSVDVPYNAALPGGGGGAGTAAADLTRFVPERDAGVRPGAAATGRGAELNLLDRAGGGGGGGGRETT